MTGVKTALTRHCIYDETGNLTKDIAEEIDSIYWNVYGKVRHIQRSEASSKPALEFRYDASGQRVVKLVKNGANERDWSYQYYVRDAQGNVMATYSKKSAISADNNAYQQINDWLAEEKSTDTFADFASTTLANADRFVGALIEATAETGDPEAALSLYQPSDFFSWDINLAMLIMSNIHLHPVPYDEVYDLVLNNGMLSMLYSIMVNNCLYPTEDILEKLLELDAGNNTLLTELYYQDVSAFYNFYSYLGGPPQPPSNPDNEIQWLWANSTNIDMANTLLLFYDLTQIEAALNTIPAGYGVGLAYDFAMSYFYEFTQLIAHCGTITGNFWGSFNDQSLLREMLFIYVPAEYLLTLALQNDPAFLYNLVLNQSHLVAEALLKLEDMDMQQYLSLVQQYYGSKTLNDLLDELAGYFRLTQKFTLSEHHLYGSSRLGVKTHRRVLVQKEFTISGFDSLGNYIMDDVTDSFAYMKSTEYFCRVLGQKQYEMTNHLGNVLATVLDRKTGVYDVSTDTLMYYEADVVNATLYYPFGQAMLSYKNEEYTFAYGLNGQEKEDEVFEGAYSAEFWMYDSRLGRRWNKDQVERPYFTVYGVLGNNPIINVDVAGDDWFVYSKTKKFLGYTYGTGYTLVWVPSSSVIFDKSKENYAYLAKSLSLHSIRKFLAIKYNSYILAEHILLPILAYHKALESTFDKRPLNGYAIFGTMQESSSISGIHSGDISQDYGTDMSKIFVANENITVQNFYSVVMYSFLTGKGPENFYFGPDHEVSKSLENSKLVTTALNLYNNGSSDDKDANDLRAGKWVNISVSELEVFGIIERSDEHGTILTPEHLVGSAQVQITESEDGKELIIRIWNTTSLGSGTVGAPRVQRPNSDADQPYTNVSQSFEIRIPKSSQ